MYKRKSGIVVKKQYDGFLLRYNQFNQKKKSTSTYNRNLRVVVFKRTNLRQKSDMNMFAENAYGGCLQLKHQICKTLDIYG